MALGTPGSATKVRRRLDFAAKPLEGESLYLDLPGYKHARELEGDLKFLGARIETFLSKDISYVVTSRKEAIKQDGGRSSPCPYPSPSPSPGVDEGGPTRKVSNVPLTRGQALLQKAQGRGRRGSCNMLSLAQDWGVKVLHVRDVLARVQRLMERYRHLAETEENAACPEENTDVKPRRLRPPFIKVEDISRQYRPLHHEFTSLPRVHFDANTECPFDPPYRGPSVPASRPNCSLKLELKPRTPATATKPVADIKKGYCECCEVYYQDGLTRHLKGDKHRSFVRDSGNFVKLDALLATLPTLDDFLKNAVTEDTQGEEETFQKRQRSEISPVAQVAADKQRSNSDGSDDVFLLSSVGEAQTHAQNRRQSTHQVTNQETEDPKNEAPYNRLRKPLSFKIEELQSGDLNRKERVPIVVLSPLPDARLTLGTRQDNGSTIARRRDERKGEAVVKEGKDFTADKSHKCMKDDDSLPVAGEITTILSSSSFSIDASCSRSSMSPSSSSSSCSSTNVTSSASSEASPSFPVGKERPTTSSVQVKNTSKATDKVWERKSVQHQHKSVSGKGAEGSRNITDVTSQSISLMDSSLSGSEDLSSSSQTSSSSSSSFRPQRHKRKGSGVLLGTSPSSDQQDNLSSPQSRSLSDCEVSCGTREVMPFAAAACCDAAEQTHTPKRHPAASGGTAAWIVAQSDNLTLRLCKASAGDGGELASPSRPEWSVERAGNLKLKIQKSSCQPNTPRNSHRASELKWSVHRSGDCKLTFSGSTRKQQRRPGLDGPQTTRSSCSRRKLKYF